MTEETAKRGLEEDMYEYMVGWVDTILDLVVMKHEGKKLGWVKMDGFELLQKVVNCDRKFHKYRR